MLSVLNNVCRVFLVLMFLSKKWALIYQEHDVISQLQEIARGKKVSFYNYLTGSIKYDRITSVCMVIRYIIKILLFISKFR